MPMPMNKYVAVVAYRCLLGGEPNGSLDFQVRYYKADSKQEVHDRISAELSNTDSSLESDRITWELSRVLAVEELHVMGDGEELVGFITNIEELSSLL